MRDAAAAARSRRCSSSTRSTGAAPTATRARRDRRPAHAGASCRWVGAATPARRRPHRVRRVDAAFTARLLDVLAEHDDALLAAYVEAAVGAVPRGCARTWPADRRALVHPVFFGSAITGAGVDALDRRHRRAPARAPAATPTHRSRARVFKIERGAGRGEGRLRADRSPARCGSATGCAWPAAGDAKVTGIDVFDAAARPRGDAVAPGRSARSARPGAVRIGDASARRPAGASTTSRRRRWRRSSSPRAPRTAARCTPRSASSPSRTR